MRRLLLGLLLVSGAARGAVMPVPSGDDARVAVARATNGEEIRLGLVIGTDLTLLLPRGELVERVELDDPAAWNAATAPRRDAIVLYALRPAQASGMRVQSDRAAYRFVIEATASGAYPYVVRLEGAGSLASPPKIWTPPVIVPPGSYKLSGDRSVLPASIRDDGRKVYMQWPASQPLPAVFALNRRGKEEMVEAYMRDNVLTIDHLVEELVFRLDRLEGKAVRLPPKVQP